MYSESGLMFPYYYYYQSFSPDIQQFDDFGSSQESFACLGSVVQSSSISDYDLGCEGDLFKAPVPIIEQPLVTTLDPMTAAMSMVSCGEDNISPQDLSVTDIESLQNEEFLTDVFHEYKDIMAKETSPLSEVLNYKFSFKTDDDNNSIVEENGQILKSMSSGCLSSKEFSHGGQVIKPSFPTITEVDFGNACGMRRAFSEGDIMTLGNCNGHSAGGKPQLINEHTMTTNEDRWQKLSRYRNKKRKRNFGRKIKYACRKALADSQPRIRGRFAKTEETEIFRK